MSPGGVCLASCQVLLPVTSQWRRENAVLHAHATMAADGSAWGEDLGAELLATLSGTERARQQKIHELIQTEERYAKAWRIVCLHYLASPGFTR